MTDKLSVIINEKKQEVIALQKLAEIHLKNIKRSSLKSFKSALKNNKLSVIAEIKRQSPSKGKIGDIGDPINLAMKYIQGNANAISVLTDQKFFGGSIEDLQNVSAALEHYPCPVLRKDFIIHEIQIAQAIASGADAILLIVAVLGKKIKNLLDYAKKMNIDVLVEVHNLQEINIAIESGAEVIGINNRNLSDFTVDANLGLDLIKHIPDYIIKVAESGILEPALAQKYYHAGFDAVLIGEALVKSNNPVDFIRACRDA